MFKFLYLSLCVLIAIFISGCGGSKDIVTQYVTTNWTVPAAGGTFTAANGAVSLVVPNGAVSTATIVQVAAITPTPPANMTAAPGCAFSFSHTTFTTPATLTISFANAGLTTAAVAGLQLFRQEDGTSTWTMVSSNVDTNAKTVTAQIGSFSSYALFYPATGAQIWHWTSAGGTFGFGNLTVLLHSEGINSPVDVQPRVTQTPFRAPTGFAAVPNASYDLGASDPNFQSLTPTTFIISFNPADVPAVDQPELSMFWKENPITPWVRIPSSVSLSSQLVTASNTKLGTFALFYVKPATTTTLRADGVSVVAGNLRITAGPQVLTQDFDANIAPSAGTPIPPNGFVYIPHTSTDFTSNETLQLAQPLQFTANYSLSDVPAAQRSEVKMFYRANATHGWVQLTSTADGTNGTATASNSALGTYALFYPELPPNGLIWTEYSSGTNGNDYYINEWTGSATAAPIKLDSYYNAGTTADYAMRNTFRPSDKTLLVSSGADGTGTSAMVNSVNIRTGASTTLITFIQQGSGTNIFSLNASWSVRGGQDVAYVLTTKSTTDSSGMAKLLVNHTFAGSPTVVDSHTMANVYSDPAPFTLLDVSSTGQILVNTSAGLVVYSGSIPTTLVPSSTQVLHGRFSPSGNEVLVDENGPSAPGWKVINASTGSLLYSVVGPHVYDSADWGTDDTHVLSIIYNGTTYSLVQLDLVSASTTTILAPTTNGFFLDEYPGG